jgi:hypothetical protein
MPGFPFPPLSHSLNPETAPQQEKGWQDMIYALPAGDVKDSFRIIGSKGSAFRISLIAS